MLLAINSIMKIRVGAGLVLAAVWLIPLCIPYFIPDNELIVPVGLGTVVLILSNLSLFFLFLILFSFLGGGSISKVNAAVAQIDYYIFSKRIDIIFYFWIFVYLVNIVGSGGIPLLWILQGDPRTYVDFGLPTLGGLGNLMRAYVLTSCYLIYFHSNLTLKARRRYLYIAILLLISAFLLETGRGNGIVLLLHPIGLHSLLHEFKIKSLIKIFISIFIFIIGLGLIQVIRYSDGFDKLVMYAENSGFKNAASFDLLLIPTVMYISIPVINTDLNFQVAEFFKFEPYYSLQGILPTIIRDAIFERGDYGELVNEANNVSSYYIPFIRDFGQLGAFFVVSLILLVVAYCYNKARRGNVYYVLSYPPLFMSLVLSFFSLFFTSLVVLFYPFFVYWSLRKCIRKNVR